MKTTLARFLPIPFVLVSAAIVTAGDFNSVVMQADAALPTINVPADRFLIIRNFTQEVGATNRGTVSVTANGSTATALTASIVDPTASNSLEVINNIVVAGPAQVLVTCGDTTSCFISYRKGTD